MWTLFLACIIGFLVLILLIHQKHKHNIIRQGYALRVHVNGIRVKSTVTRILAGILRKSSYKTLAKTTGSAARIIFENVDEKPVDRQG